MSSGVGSHTSVNRCGVIWKDLVKCMKTTRMDNTLCKDFFDDYVECLHHGKEIAHYQEFVRQKEAKNIPTVKVSPYLVP